MAGTIAAGMALAALPALAHTSRVNVDNKNISKVKTIDVTVANSGINGVTQAGGFFNDADITTGPVYAGSGIEVATGSSKTIVDAPRHGSVRTDNVGVSKVRTLDVTVANSGVNRITQTGGVGNDANIGTGGAQAESESVFIRVIVSRLSSSFSAKSVKWDGSATSGTIRDWRQRLKF